MYGKSNMETYITICKIDSQWEFAVWLRKLKHRLSVNLGASLVAQLVRTLPAVQETWVQSLCWHDLLEQEIATHSSILFFFLIYFNWRLITLQYCGGFYHTLT